jgi:hypothetical protein
MTGRPVCGLCGRKLTRGRWVFSKHTRRHYCLASDEEACTRRARRRTRKA